MQTITSPSIISTPRTLLRPIQLSDFPHILSLLSDPNVLRYLALQPILTEDQAKAFTLELFYEHRTNRGYSWVITDQTNPNTVLGFISSYADPTAPTIAEIGYLLYPEHHNKGYATEALHAITAWLRTHPIITTLHAIVHPLNTPSISLLKKHNFTLHNNPPTDISWPQLPVHLQTTTPLLYVKSLRTTPS